jgi:group I intron endonuclease
MPNIIYLATNQINSKIYIGKTVHSVEQRWSQHVGSARSGSTTYFHNAIRKYGADAFEISILEAVDDTGVLNEREIHWIATLHPDYNMTPGGDGHTVGYKCSAESRARMSAAQTGRKHSAETRQKISDDHIGHKHSAATKQKISDAGRRRPPISDATRAKMSAANKGRKLPPISDATRQKLRDAARRRLPISDAARAKMSAASKGRKMPPRSDATRQRMSDAAKRRWSKCGTI